MGSNLKIDHFSGLVLQGKTESNILSSEITSRVLDTMEKALIDSGYPHLTQPRR